MSFTVLDIEQRSPAWHQARAGRATGSRAGDIFATRKDGKEAAARRDYRTQLVCERLTGLPQEDAYIGGDMRRGNELEATAFALYEAMTGQVVRKTGFIVLDDEMIGTSLDGDIEDFTGIVEIKCPRAANHLAYVRAGGVPYDYLHQIVHGQLVTGAHWTDFVSFCPAFPPELQLFIVRLPRDDKQVHSYRMALTLFLSEVERDLADVRKLLLDRFGVTA